MREDKMLRVSCCMRSVEEWFPSHNQLIVDVDEEGRKIFEAFYGTSLKSSGVKYDAQCMNFMNLTDVIGAADDDDTRTLAEFAVDQYNKNKKEMVVKAIMVRPSMLMVFYLITLQALGESTDPRKFFARVLVSLAPYDGRKLDDWMPRKQKKLFLREMAAHLEEDKLMFLGNIADKLKSLMQFKEQDWFTFEEEDAFSCHSTNKIRYASQVRIRQNCMGPHQQNHPHHGGLCVTKSPGRTFNSRSSRAKADLQYSAADL
ncbi:unnamed protein product [Camellia sinensis]